MVTLLWVRKFMKKQIKLGVLILVVNSLFIYHLLRHSYLSQLIFFLANAYASILCFGQLLFLHSTRFFTLFWLLCSSQVVFFFIFTYFFILMLYHIKTLSLLLWLVNTDLGNHTHCRGIHEIRKVSKVWIFVHFDHKY